MKNLIILSAIVFGFISCVSDDSPEPNTLHSVDRGSYDILIDNKTTGVKTRLIDKNADTNWDPTTGAIFMNTDDSLSCGNGVCPCLLGPIGTVTMTVRNIHDDWADINSILVSKSDIVCGTAADLNAQLFASNQIEVIDSLLIGANFIAGKIIKIPMDLQTLNSTQQPERAEVTVAFIAIDR